MIQEYFDIFGIFEFYILKSVKKLWIRKILAGSHSDKMLNQQSIVHPQEWKDTTHGVNV